jgi:hypothetical protein
MRAPRPPQSTLGLLIPTSGPPAFHYIKYHETITEFIPDLTPILGTDKIMRTLLGWNTVLNKVLVLPLQSLPVPNQLLINGFINELAEGKGYSRYQRETGGPSIILAHEHTKIASNKLIWRDVVCEDLRWMFGYWKFGDEPMEKGLVQGVISDHKDIGPQGIKGVVIACQAERQLAGTTYIEVCISPTHPIWAKTPTQISVKMELPLLTHAFSVQLIPNSIPNAEYKNPEASAMHRIVDLEDARWGLIPEKASGNIGSVLVVRLDRKDLDVKQAETLAEFCDSLLGDGMHRVLEGRHPRSKENYTDKIISKAVFYQFTVRKALDEGDASWDHAWGSYFA